MKKTFIFLAAAAVFMLTAAPASNKKAPAQKAAKKTKARKVVLPPGVKPILYPCTIDNSQQRAISFIAKGDNPRPLLVALHSWSGTYRQNCNGYARFCVQNNWNFIFPNFRGQNWHRDACGSDKVVQDIVDAVAYMKKVAKVDPKRVYIMGGSGGGHATLLMVGRHPELWTAASAWCPISDIAAWHEECSKVKRYRGYAQHIRKACGGNPAKDAKAKAQAVKRSPLTYLARAGKVKLDINAGIHDGHTGSVRVSHSLNAFNALSADKDKISQEDIDYIVANRKIPAKFGKAQKDPAFRRNVVHFRRQSNQVRVTLFEGGHSILYRPALAWLAKQNSGKPADWSIGSAKNAETVREIAK